MSFVKKLLHLKKEKKTEYDYTEHFQIKTQTTQTIQTTQILQTHQTEPAKHIQASSLDNLSASQNTEDTTPTASTKDSLDSDSDDSFDQEHKAEAMKDVDRSIEITGNMYCINNPGALQFFKLIFRRCNNFTLNQLINIEGKNRCVDPSARYVKLQFIKCCKLNDADLSNLGMLLGSRVGNIEYLSIEIKGNSKFTQQGMQKFLGGIAAGKKNQLKYLELKVRRCKYLGEKNAPSLKCAIMHKWPELKELVLNFDKEKTGLMKSLMKKSKKKDKISDDNMAKITDMAQEKIASLGLMRGSLYSETTVVYFNRVFSNKEDYNGKTLLPATRQI